MSTYTLSATLDGVVEHHRFTAADDDDATLDATFAILDLALQSKVWARGRINLLDRQGNIIRTMEEKENES